MSDTTPEGFQKRGRFRFPVKGHPLPEEILKKELDKKIVELIDWIVRKAPIMIREMKGVPYAKAHTTRWLGGEYYTPERGFVNVDVDEDQFFFAITEKAIMEAVDRKKKLNRPEVIRPVARAKD